MHGFAVPPGSESDRMRHESVLLALLSFVVVAQPGPTAEPQLQEQALRFIEEGHFGGARDLLADLVQRAHRNGSPVAYQAELYRLLGLAENRLGRYDEAQAALAHGVQLLDRNESVPSQLRVSLLVESADAQLNQGNLEQADRVLRRALTIASRDLPPRDPRLASVHHSLGILFWRQGQLSRAEKALRLSLTMLEGSLGPDDVDVAVVANGLAGLLTMTGRTGDAIPLFERTKAVLERRYGPSHPDTIGATYALAVALGQSAPSKAEFMLRHAIASWRRSHPERHPHMIKFLAALATVRWAQGDSGAAGILSEQALDMSREIFGREHPYSVAQMYEHAQLLRDTGRRKEAAAVKREADRVRSSHGYEAPARHRIDILALQ